MRNAVGPRLRAGLLLLLVGGIGFVGGLLAERLLLSDPVPANGGAAAWTEQPVTIIRGTDSEARVGQQRIFRLGLPQELAEELDLTDEQRTEIERILAEDQAVLREAMAEFEPRMREIVERSRQKIQEVLTEEQRERWTELPTLRLRTPESAPPRR